MSSEHNGILIKEKLKAPFCTHTRQHFLGKEINMDFVYFVPLLGVLSLQRYASTQCVFNRDGRNGVPV